MNDMSPFVRTREKCKRALIYHSDDEQMIEHNTDVNYFLNYPLLKVDRALLSNSELEQLKELDYEIMTQICDKIGAYVELLESCIDLKDLYDTHREIVSKMSDSTPPKREQITFERQSDCGSPDLLNSFDSDDDICIIDEPNERKTDDKSVVDLCDDYSSPNRRSIDFRVDYDGETTPSLCSIDCEDEIQQMQHNSATNNDDIANLSELVMEELNYKEEEQEKYKFNNIFEEKVSDFDANDNMDNDNPFNNYRGKVIEVKKSQFNGSSKSSTNDSCNLKFDGKDANSNGNNNNKNGVKLVVKTLGPAVRKKDERKQLNGYACKECEDYYKQRYNGISDDEMKMKMKKCSRHRAKWSPIKSPEHFWNTDFPSTQECLRNGNMRYDEKCSPIGIKKYKKKKKL